MMMQSIYDQDIRPTEIDTETYLRHVEPLSQHLTVDQNRVFGSLKRRKDGFPLNRSSCGRNDLSLDSSIVEPFDHTGDHLDPGAEYQGRAPVFGVFFVHLNYRFVEVGGIDKLAHLFEASMRSCFDQFVGVFVLGGVFVLEPRWYGGRSLIRMRSLCDVETVQSFPQVENILVARLDLDRCHTRALAMS